MTAAPRQIVVVDDEPELRSLLKDYLTLQGLAVRCAADAAGLFREIDRAPADAILLDVAMPGASGFEALGELRRRGVAAGVLLLTAADTEPDRIRGLLAGADDYITKPFVPREVLARLRAVLRRLPASAAPPPAQVVPLGACRYDTAARALTGPDGAPIPITAGEVDLIEVFLRHPGQTLSRERLQVLTGGDGAAAGGRGIDLRILRLRQKIEADPRAPALICTLRGEGYVYRPDRR